MEPGEEGWNSYPSDFTDVLSNTLRATRCCQYAGFSSISPMKRLAIGLGGRVPCSHERIVFGSTPKKRAKNA